MEQKLREALARRQKRRIVEPKRIPAAVLLPIYYKRGQYYILFIRRTDKVKVHRGEISFPGGAREEKDKTLLDTARRESAEEIGLKSEDIEILGELDDEVSMTTHYVIATFVALIPCPYQFKVDGEETEEIIEVPLAALLDTASSEEKVSGGELVTSYSYQYRDKIIWGTTARILKKFLDIFVQVKEGGG